MSASEIKEIEKIDMSSHQVDSETRIPIAAPTESAAVPSPKITTDKQNEIQPFDNLDKSDSESSDGDDEEIEEFDANEYNLMLICHYEDNGVDILPD
jgi:hypothetical protein